MATPTRFYSVRDFARRVRLTPPAIYDAIRRKRLHPSALTYSGLKLFTERDVEQFMATRVARLRRWTAEAEAAAADQESATTS